MRKLASIQKVEKIFPILKADNIEGCQILGWEIVVRKGEFKEGDLCVFFEIDSLLPAIDDFEFMKASNYKVKTIKLRGQISQGLALPLHKISKSLPTTIGEDVSELLGVSKYEPDELDNKTFPEFLHKTDEVRIQAIPELLTTYKGQSFYITEKLDGCSVSFYVRDGQFGICSRNRLQSNNHFGQVAQSLNIERKLRSLGNNICFQGEIIGPKIQGNRYNLSEYDVRFFSVFDIEKQSYYDFENLCSIINWVSLETVPIIGIIELNHTIKELIELSTGKSKLYDTMREGIVVRKIDSTKISFKVISPEFLLRQDA
jgi:RNA ligase (TIGR02306 family)